MMYEQKLSKYFFKKNLELNFDLLLLQSQTQSPNAQVAEQVDALVSNTNGSNAVLVRFQSWVLMF